MKLRPLFAQYHESLLMMAALLAVLLCLLKPDIQLKQDVHNILLLADVSQSMNAQDRVIGQKTVSRMAYTQLLMKRLVSRAACGTYFSVGVFAGESVGLLLTPLEVCANYDVLIDTIDHLEWRMSWRGNSRLSFGVKAAEKMFDYLNTPAELLFFTDGEEAPKVNAINKLDLSAVQIGNNLVFVGIGGNQPVPVPRYNSNNQWVGYWSTDTKENSAGAVGDKFSDTSKDDPDPLVAYAEYDRYLSTQDAEYLKSLAAEIKASYINGTDSDAFYQFVESRKPAASFVTAYPMRGFYLGVALLCLLATYAGDLRIRVLHLWQQLRRIMRKPSSAK